MGAREIEWHFPPGTTVSPNDAVVIVDGDVGFLLWLSYAFAARGYVPIAVTSAAEAGRLTGELSLGIAAFIVNLNCSGCWN